MIEFLTLDVVLRGSSVSVCRNIFIFVRTLKEAAQDLPEERDKDLASKFPRSSSDSASMRPAVAMKGLFGLNPPGPKVFPAELFPAAG